MFERVLAALCYSRTIHNFDNYSDEERYQLANLKLALTIIWRCSERTRNILSLKQQKLISLLNGILQLQIKDIDLPALGFINQLCITVFS